MTSITELNLAEVFFIAGGQGEKKKKKRQNIGFLPNSNRGRSIGFEIAVLGGSIAFSLAMIAGFIIYVRKQGHANLAISLAYTAVYMVAGTTGYKLAAHLFKD